MSFLQIRFGADNQTDNYNVPFYVEIIQNNAIVLSAFSTEGNKSTSFIKETNSFDATQQTTIKYYNLGLKQNYIAILLLNAINNQILTDGSIISQSGQVAQQVINIPAGSFAGYLSIKCNEAYSTLSGVDFIGSGTISNGLYPYVISRKISDSSFVGVTTPNTSLNPNYVSPVSLTAPTVSQTSILDSQNLVVAGMQSGDILHFFLDSIDQTPDGIVISSTGQISIPLSGYGGKTAYFNYVRGSQTSPNSSNVTILSDATVLPTLTVSTDTSRPNVYIGEWIDVTDITSGATLKIGVTSSNFTAIEGTDYTKTTISGGFRIIPLKAQIYNFYQSKSGFSDSLKFVINVGSVRPNLANPIPSSFSLLVNQTVTITNQSNFDNILVYRNQVLIIESDGYFSLSGGVYTFLQTGTYNFVGQKSGQSDSGQSGNIIVQTTVNIPVLACNLFQNQGGTYNVVSGGIAILNASGILPSGGQLVYYEKNLNTNTLVPKLTTEIIESYTTNSIVSLTYGYVAKFKDDYGNLSNESNVISFAFVTQSKTDTPTISIVNNNSIKAIFGSSGTSKDIEIWGLIAPSASFVKIGNTITTTASEYTFATLQNGTYKVRSTQSGLTQSDFSSELTILVSGTVQRFQYINDNALNLWSVGNILDSSSSGAGYRWISQEENASLECIITQQDNVNSNGLSGVAIIDVNSFDLVSVDAKFISILAKNNGTIGVFRRTNTGGNTELVKIQNANIPIRLKIEKAGNDALMYYSTDTTSTAVIYTLFQRINGVFSNYTGFAIALVASSGTTEVQETRFSNIVGNEIKVGKTGSI